MTADFFAITRIAFFADFVFAIDLRTFVSAMSRAYPEAARENLFEEKAARAKTRADPSKAGVIRAPPAFVNRRSDPRNRGKRARFTGLFNDCGP
ncbi:hypothetical protein [Parvibaculum sp.]|uniref:hypothetical protein n=1 Tax=Parvibaculum sp. TaxID=2024848 RepID=UPI003BAB6AFC